MSSKVSVEIDGSSQAFIASDFKFLGHQRSPLANNKRHLAEYVYITWHFQKNDVNGEKCTICLANPFEILFQPCGHVCVCQDCAKTLYEKSQRLQPKCPICRAVINDSQRIYLS